MNWNQMNECSDAEFDTYLATLTAGDVRCMSYALKCGLQAGDLTQWQTRRERMLALSAPTARRERIALELVQCSCGHSASRESVMTTGHGTSCPDCYDRLSE